MNWKLLFLFLLIVCISCKQAEEGNILTVSEAALLSEDTFCPYFTTDSDGNSVISFVKQKGENDYVFAYAVSNDGGETFGDEIEIPGSYKVQPKEENIPKVIFTPDGEIMAVWTEPNPDEEFQFYDIINYSISSDKGKSWSQPKRLVPGETSYNQSYFDLALLPDGNIGIVWLDERKKENKEGSGLFFARTSENLIFTNEQLIGGPACECCQAEIMTDSKDNLHILYREIINDSIRDAVHFSSANNGRTFNEPKRISEDNWIIFGCPHTGPAMTETADGDLAFTWFSGIKEGGVFYTFSNDDGKTYSARSKVADGLMVMQSSIAPLGKNTLISWNHDFDSPEGSRSKIGVEIRNANGESIAGEYFDSLDGDMGYPVVLQLSNTEALVAYSLKNDNGNSIYYQKVSYAPQK